MQVQCTRCRTAFDTDREPITPGQNTHRCPSCGQKHDPETTTAIEEVTDGGNETDTIAFEVTLTVRVDVPEKLAELEMQNH